jgi:hypothetical protein
MAPADPKLGPFLLTLAAGNWDTQRAINAIVAATKIMELVDTAMKHARSNALIIAPRLANDRSVPRLPILHRSCRILS